MNTPHISLRISRYEGTTWSMAVEPDDRAWTLFVDREGKPHLYAAGPEAMVYPPPPAPAPEG